MAPNASAGSQDSKTSDRSFLSSSSEPDFVLGPLALVAAAAFIRAARRRRPGMLAVAIAAVTAEFGWPAYSRFKRNPAVPTLLARYPNA
jgi:hypothetical protein